MNKKKKKKIKFICKPELKHPPSPSITVLLIYGAPSLACDKDPRKGGEMLRILLSRTSPSILFWTESPGNLQYSY